MAHEKFHYRTLNDVLDKALEVLGDPALYQQTLEAPGKVEKTATL